MGLMARTDEDYAKLVAELPGAENLRSYLDTLVWTAKRLGEKVFDVNSLAYRRLKRLARSYEELERETGHIPPRKFSKKVGSIGAGRTGRGNFGGREFFKRLSK